MSAPHLSVPCEESSSNKHGQQFDDDTPVLPHTPATTTSTEELSMSTSLTTDPFLVIEQLRADAARNAERLEKWKAKVREMTERDLATIRSLEEELAAARREMAARAERVNTWKRMVVEAADKDKVLWCVATEEQTARHDIQQQCSDEREELIYNVLMRGSTRIVRHIFDTKINTFQTVMQSALDALRE
eukprot:PhM_4_TR12024/c0_g2_i1/m.65255